ncbi:alpha/beta fold hydrolase [Smaragdicoccus niigatensis]|uniref:alpha/beta fold hydrolase n=1 Tax=Smaragdicoccus niigatensis TaxID=359359 RepID=UPI000360E521|nr:alpha/beta hydrolase [Smaragdicoccus niigatensis]
MRVKNAFSIFTLALILVVPACSKSDSSSSSPPTTVSHPPAKYVAGTCAQVPHPVPMLDGASCGALTVPLQRTKSGDKTITLAVATLPSKIQPPTKPPLVILTGGPGQDALASPPINDKIPLNTDRDVILMGQRGNLTSSIPMACPEIDKFAISRLGMVFFAKSTGDAYVQAVKECRDRLSPNVDFTAFNSVDSAYDLIDLRKALGIDKWDVFTHSYGTDLGLIYLRMDAPAINSIAFDGVTPPSVAALGWTWASAKEAFDNMTKACDAQPACKERYPDLAATFIRLVSELEQNPVTTTVGDTKVVIDGGKLLAWFTPVATHLPVDFPAQIDALDHGNPQPLAESMVMAFGNPDNIGMLAWGMTLSIWCREWVPFETPAETLKQANDAFPTFPDSVKAQGIQLPFLRDACAAWNVPKAPDSIRDITKSDIPSLVLSGSYDGQTGAVWGEYIAKNLSQSTVAVVPGVAHGVYAEPCGGEIIASFFDNPKKPDTSCENSTPLPAYSIPPAQ